MPLKEKIIQYWLTFVLTFIGVSKVLIFIPFVLQINVRNRHLTDFIDFIFKPADYISGLFVIFAAFSGPMIFLMMFLAAIAKFLLFAAEAYILAKLIIFLAKSESVKNLFGNAFIVLCDKLEINNKMEKYPALKNAKYFMPLIAIIILAIVVVYSLPKKNNNGNAGVVAEKETLAEQAGKIEIGIDSDGDGLPNSAEFVLGTNPYFADTDNDGFTDYNELKNGYNPFIASPGDKLSDENYELIKQELFSGKNTQFSELEKLRLVFIGQISNRLCEKSQYAGENNLEDGKQTAKQAIKAGDPCLCSKIQDDQHRNSCFNKLANTTINISLCNYIFEESTAQSPRDNCLHTSMLITLNEKYCDRIKDAKKQGECFLVLGLKTKNYTLCDKIKDPGEKDSCYYGTAIFAKKIDLCDKISPDNKGGDSREACKSMINSGLIPKVNF